MAAPKEQACTGPMADDSVYRHRGHVPTPRFLYVHYINKPLPPFDVHLFEHPEPVGDIQSAVKDAVAQIQNDHEPLPKLPDGGVEWTEASYAVFVLTPDQGRLPKCDGVTIKHKWWIFLFKNHAFFNGADLDDVGGCSAMYCINFRRNRRGNALGMNERERFVWHANHRRSFRSILGLKFFTHEGSGTNTGP